MKKIFTRINLLLALLIFSAVAMANNKDYYSKATATAVPSAAGKVYVAYNKAATTGNGTTAESGKVSQENAPTHTYYFLAVTSNADGYSFAGWWTAKTGGTQKNKELSYSESITAAEKVADATMNRYARWTAKSFAVTFNPNDGNDNNPATLSFTSDSVTFQSKYGNLPTASRRFYTFNGWFTEASGGTQVTTDTTVNTTGDRTLFAHWTLTPENQTLAWGESMQFNMAKGTRQPIVVSSTSGLTAFTYESDNTEVVSIDGEYLKANAPGEATITVTQAGNDYFYPATLTAKFSVWSKETPVLTENGFSEGTNDLKVDDVVTLNLSNVSDGLDGDFTVTASTDNIIGITREGNTLTFTALHEGSTTITVAQAENEDIFGASKTYTFNVSRYTPEFTLSATELELEQTALLSLSHVDGQHISFAPEGIVSYDANTGILTAVAPGSTTLTITQPLTNSIEAKETSYEITVSKKTPSLSVLMNGTARTSLSVNRGSTATIAFNKVSDAEVVVTPVSGTQYASYVNGIITAGAVGTATYRASLAETETYRSTSVDFTVTVTSSTSHLPVSGKSYTIGSASATDWTHHYETLSFQGIPDKLSFNFAYIYTAQSNIGNPTLNYDNLSDVAKFFLSSSVDDSKRGHGNTHMLYVEESADGNSWTTIWTDDDATNKDTRSSGAIQLSKTTRYIRFHHSCNFSNSYTNIAVTELKYLETPDPESIDFGSAVINSGEVSRTSLINWCNIAPLTVTSSNPRFTATPATFANFEQYSTQELTIRYTHTNTAGTNEGDITITNGAQTRTIHVKAATTKRPQTITWDAGLSATGFAMNVGEQYPDAESVPVVATVTNGERITFTSDNPEVVEVIADTALLAKSIGTANITAYQAGDAEYEEVSSTKEFVVTLLQKQSITWDQNLYGLLTTSGSVELTATATSGGPITYTSANPQVVSVNGNVLTVEGEGETTITATQGGYTDDEGIEWLAVSQDNYVIVRNPASQCNQKALSQGSLTLNGSKKQQDYNLSGTPAVLTFSAKHGTKNNSSWGSASYSALIVEQYVYKDGTFDWYEVYNKVVGTSNTSSGNIPLDEAATKLRFRTLETGTDHTISNIQVSRKKILSVDIETINQEAETNSAWQQVITVNHSNIDLMTLSTKNGLLTLSSATLGEGCADFGDDYFSVSFVPTQKNREYRDTIVITDGKDNPATIEIPVRLTTKGLNQSINDFDLPAEALTTDVIAVSATASSGLEVSFESSDNQVAYVENGRLVILSGGTVTITAKQEGNDKYDAAQPIEKTIVITKVSTAITTAPTASNIVYGQPLSASSLTDGEGSVAGSFAWETPDAIPAAGTPSYNVLFVPEQSGIYATASTLVSLRVEKATPAVSAWPVATEITIAQSLADAVLQNGAADVAGTFAWKNPTENRLKPGEYERTVVFTPEDADNYKSVEGTVSVTVVNVLARIDEKPVAVADQPVYGITLSEVELMGGSANVAGSFAWAEPATVAQAGEHSYPVIFTPEDLELYAVVQLEVSLTVEKATPVITEAPVATPLTYGQSLEASALSGQANVEGLFQWAVDLSTTPAVGEHRYAVVFSPSDADNYYTVDTAATVIVGRADVTLTAPSYKSLTYTGEAQELVNAGETQDGTFYYRLGEDGLWSNVIPFATSAGEYEVYYQVIGDANHNDSEVLGPVYVEIAKAQAEVSVLPVAEEIAYGQSLSEASFIGGEANTPGTFSWSNPEVQPEVGTAEYEVVFTPDNLNDYNPAILQVALTVHKLAQTIEWTEELAPMVITEHRMLSATASSGLEVVFSSSDEEIAYFEGHVLHAVAAGTVIITATQAGDDHYAAAEPVVREMEVQNIVPVEAEITHLPEPTAIIYGQPLSMSELLNAEAAVAGTFAWAEPDAILPEGTQSANVLFTPEDQVYYLPTLFAVEIVVLPVPTLYGDYDGAFCDGDSIEFAGVWYHAATRTEVLLAEKNIYGGDSIVRLNLTLNPVYNTAEQMTFYSGQSRVWQGLALDAMPVGDTTLVRTYATVEGCDSIHTLHLTVLPKVIAYGADTINLCKGERAVYEGKTYRRPTETDVLLAEKNIYGGDSIVHLVVYVHPVMRMTSYKTITEGDQAMWQNIDLSTISAGDTTLIAEYVSVHGCDSVYELHLEVLTRIATGTETIDDNTGKTEKFFHNGKMYIRKNNQVYNLQGIKVETLD